MVYGELGRYPLNVTIQTRITSYWAKLLHGKNSKISSLLYKLGYIHNSENRVKITWIEKVKNILDNCGLSNIWSPQSFPNIKWIKSKVKLTLTDQFKQNWSSTLQNSPKALNYRIYKENLQFENYLNILSKKDALILCRFRTCNNNLPIETGRWHNIPRENRVCQKCNLREIGDEFHYILNCKALTLQRKKCLLTKHIANRNIITFSEIMSSKKQSFLRKLCTFVKTINELCSSP